MNLPSQPAPVRNRLASQGGWTLVELLVSVMLSAVVLGAVVTGNITIARAMIATANYDDMNAASRKALDLLSLDVRNAAYVTNYSSSSMTLVNTFNSVTRVTYTWDGTNCFKRSEDGGRERILLSGCSNFNFNYFLRVPQPNLQFLATTNPISLTSTKLISVSWVCCRSILGSKQNTESVQTANIAIRN